MTSNQIKHLALLAGAIVMARKKNWHAMVCLVDAVCDDWEAVRSLGKEVREDTETHEGLETLQEVSNQFGRLLTSQAGEPNEEQHAHLLKDLVRVRQRNIPVGAPLHYFIVWASDGHNDESYYVLAATERDAEDAAEQVTELPVFAEGIEEGDWEHLQKLLKEQGVERLPPNEAYLYCSWT